MELGISSLDEENVLKLNVMVSQPFKHKKNYGIVYLKWMNCTIWELYLNKKNFFLFLFNCFLEILRMAQNFAWQLY